MIVLASLVGSWFGISCGFGLENVVSVRGSHRDGDKALRHRGGRRLGQDGRANRTWLKVCFSLLTTFKCWLLIYNRESDIIISLWTCTNLPFRFSEKRDFSQRFGHWFLWPDLLLGSFLGLGEWRPGLFWQLHRIQRAEPIPNHLLWGSARSFLSRLGAPMKLWIAWLWPQSPILG